MPFIRDRTQFVRNKALEDESLLQNIERSDEDFEWTRPSAPSTSQSNANTPPISEKNVKDAVAAALLIVADLSTKLLVTHPCAVLRRQCQVHQFAKSLHLTPITLIPSVCNLVGKEGTTTLWKGSIGSSVVYLLSNASLVLLADVLGLPRHFVENGSSEKYWRHILLQSITSFLMTPFYIASFAESVRSGAGLGPDDNRIFDVLSKGVDRLRFAVFGSRDASKRFSVLHLAVPTVMFRTSHFIIEQALYTQLFHMARRYMNKKPEHERSKFHDYIPLMFGRLTSSILTDLILFPVETVLHRMYIQGTRTLIDNLDTGTAAISMSIKYTGFFNCLRTTVENEGILALYSGIGALGMQYILHNLIHQFVRACFDSGSEMLRKATAQHIVTPPLSTNTSYAGSSSGPFSNPASFNHQLSSPPLLSPRSKPVVSPPRDPTQFPTFGESAAQFDANQPSTFNSNRPNVFGTPRKTATVNSQPSLSLNTDAFGSDPFSG